ncbi:MAG: DUF664 domain-containing protein, partial [Actinomycetota bacterium]
GVHILWRFVQSPIAGEHSVDRRRLDLGEESADMWATPEESSEYLIGLYERACAHGDQTIADLDLQTPGWVAHWPEDRRDTTLGVLLIRMVAETAQHAGHADIIRELIDGRAGPDHDAIGNEAWWREYVAAIQAAADSFATAAQTGKPTS